MKYIIGMIHLKPLPGTPDYDGDLNSVYESALEDLKKLQEAGFKYAIVENMGDEPFTTKKLDLLTYSAYLKILTLLKEKAKLKLGVSIQMNHWKEMLFSCHTTNCEFIRIGAFAEERMALEGKIGPCAGELLRLKKQIDSNIKIAADIQVKHTVSTVEGFETEYILKTASKFADYIVATGAETGKPIDENYLKELRELTDKSIWVGSGVNEKNIKNILKHSDGVIVGTSIKKDNITTNPVDFEKAKRIIIEGGKI